MSQRKGRRKRGRHRGTAAKANSDLMLHIESLGLQTVSSYQDWCRGHSISGALNKRWQERRQERRIAQLAREEERADAGLMRHIRALGMETSKEYQSWCRDNGFGGGANKSRQQRKKEVVLAGTLKSEAALTGMKAHQRRPRDMILRIF